MNRRLATSAIRHRISALAGHFARPDPFHERLLFPTDHSSSISPRRKAEPLAVRMELLPKNKSSTLRDLLTSFLYRSRTVRARSCRFSTWPQKPVPYVPTDHWWQ